MIAEMFMNFTIIIGRKLLNMNMHTALLLHVCWVICTE